jgi:hypothetical protein
MIQTSLLTFTIRSRIKISPTSTGQKKAVSMNFLTLSSRLATARRDLASNSDKKPKKRRTFAKKNRLKNREIRKNRINLLLFTFENRRKIKEKSALFGGPYRNSDRQFFYSPKILDFCCLYLSSKCIKKTSWFMPYSGIHYVSPAGDFCPK